MARVFVIRPFEKKKDSAGNELDFEQVQASLIDPVLKAANLGGGTTGQIVEPGNIREDMFALILEADLVICDITIHNANVFYELGIRHALRKRHTILIKGQPTADGTPFDVLTDRYLAYEVKDPGKAQEKLLEVVEAALRSDRETDSPIFRMLPTLTEADPTPVVPLDFREEVDRARTAKSKGWLRLLAHEVRGQRFKWIGLQLVAEAQWKVEDYEGARESLEAIRETHRVNVDANLSLANIYERLSRKDKKPELLMASDQAIERVLVSRDAPSQKIVEALALKGRNQKTRWRREIESLGTVEERRKAAMNQKLRDSYQAYRDAFYRDLNHFYSGLAALQMGMIFLDLSPHGNEAWRSTFDSDDEAAAYRQKLARDVEALRLIVLASIEAALQRLRPGDSERTWAEISKIDHLFLLEKIADRVINRYMDVLPKENPFAWNAARGQLKLFADLGFRAELAQGVIAAVENELKTEPEKTRSLHVVMFAGHRVDEPERSVARFPAQQEARAQELIRETFSQLNKDSTFLGLASAAPGSDILFHEACAEINVPTTLCLPMPAADYGRLAFQNLDSWRSRFLRLRREMERKQRKVLELSDREGLPRWLQGSDTNPWERGNRWVLEMALTSGADEVTLIALWDGKDEGDAPGGTAHMVQLARSTGKVDVKIIKAEKLLE